MSTHLRSNVGSHFVSIEKSRESKYFKSFPQGEICDARRLSFMMNFNNTLDCLCYIVSFDLCEV
jgi:hypothetical protein